MLKDYNKIEELDQETLASDMDFIEDASIFLSEREGINEAMTPKEVYEAFMEHMRYQDVNEVTAIRDLEYAQNANTEGKERFGRLIDAYDKVNEDVSGRMLWDYGAGILTAPSTYLGILSGGTGKAAAMAGTQTAKFGLRRILSGALKAAAVEGAIGTGQGAVQENVRVETGIQDEWTGERTAFQGLASAATGGLINLPIGMLQAKKANRASELYETAKVKEAERANEAVAKSDEVISQASSESVEEVKDVLNALDPTKVAEGRRLKQDLMPGDTMEAALGSDVVKNITAAALRVKDEIKLGKGERITDGLHRLLDEGKLEELDDIQKIIGEHNLTMDQFSLVFYAEISDAGKKLGTMSRLEAAVKGRKGKVKKTEVGRLTDKLDDLHTAGRSGLSGDDVLQLNSNEKVMAYVKDLDRMRLGLMTSQPATTMRNNLNGGMRIAIDAAVRTMDNMVENAYAVVGQGKFKNPFDGTMDLAKYTLNPYEGMVIQQLFRESFPEESARLFRQAADLSAANGSETVLGKIGRKVNVLNTMSDNFFKRGMLAASLKRRLSDEGLDLHDIIAKGEFGKIDNDIMQKAIQDSYEFTYQAGMRGDDFFSKMSRSVNKAHRDYPFLISAFMPFPRFVANQLKFTYEHMPILGMMPLDRLGSKQPARSAGEYIREKLPKQMAGSMMLFAAYQWRLQQGDSAYWYEIKDGKGDYIDGRPVYGPFAPFMLVADLIYRGQRGTLPTSISRYVKDTTQALLGSTFRAGTGLYMLDKMYQDIADGRAEKFVAETLGNIANTYTLPLAVVKDFYGQFDKQSRAIPESRTGDRKPDEDLVNFLDIMYNRATRSFPDFSFINGYDQAMVSATKTGELRAVNPIEKQIFGFGKRTKNAMEKEMAKLNITPYELYRRPKNDTLDLYMRQELSRDNPDINLEQYMEKFIGGDAYKNLPSLEAKRVNFENAVREKIAEAKKIAEARIEFDAGQRGLPYSELTIQSWVDTTPLIKRAVEKEYIDKFGGKGVTEDRNKTINIDGTDTNVLVWATSRAEQMNKKASKL